MNIKTKLDSFSLIFIFAFVFYLIVLFYVLNNPQIALTGDAEEYIKEAENIFLYQTVYCGEFTKKIEPDLFSRRPPLYPFLIAMLLLVFRTFYSVLFFQIFLTIFNGFLIYKILDTRNVSQKWKTIVVILYLFYPSQIIFTNIIMSEILLQTFLLLSFYFFIKYFLDNRLVQLLLFNLCLVAAVLTKPIMLFFWIINIFLHLWLFFKDRRKIILFLPLMMIVTILVWSYRNYQRTGVYHYSSIKNHNLLNYNARGFLTAEYSSDYADEVITAIKNEAAEKGSYKETNSYFAKESLTIIKNNFFGYLCYHFRGMLNFLIDPGRFDIYNFLQIKQSYGFLKLFNQHGYKGIFIIFREFPVIIICYLLLMAVINILLLVSFLCFLIKPYPDKYYKVYLLVICIYIVLLTGPIGASRFRIPIFPLILLTLPQIIHLTNFMNYVKKFICKKFCPVR